MLTQQDTGPEALEAWAQIHGVTPEALSRALAQMAEESVESLVKELNPGDKGDVQSIVDICCNRQDLKNYFINQIRCIPYIHQHIGAVVGTSSDGLTTPLYRQARIDPRQQPEALPWQNSAWVSKQWEEFFLSRETVDASSSSSSLQGVRLKVAR